MAVKKNVKAKTSPQLEKLKAEVAQEIGIADKISSQNQKEALNTKK